MPETDYQTTYRLSFAIPKAILRLCLILMNNVYCIPTYVIWMLLLTPLKKLFPDIYWKLEGCMFHWLLAMVSMWTWTAGYDIVEVGDDIQKCLDKRTLIIANHQSTGDVPLLMATFNTRKQILPNIMWIMDKLFKYTNFGVVSMIHQDFFIESGKSRRDATLRNLVDHIIQSYIPNKRKWIALFPEGGFLHKRKLVSQQYAEKNNLPMLNHVSLPRVGALQVILHTLRANKICNNNSNNLLNGENNSMNIEWILDMTIAYPQGDPITLATIIFGTRPPCTTTIYYRLFSTTNVPQAPEELTQWLFKRWEEKEKMLEHFYQTETFPKSVCHNYNPPQMIEQDLLRYMLLHIFFITSTYLHFQLLSVIYLYCSASFS